MKIVINRRWSGFEGGLALGVTAFVLKITGYLTVGWWAVAVAFFAVPILVIGLLLAWGLILTGGFFLVIAIEHAKDRRRRRASRRRARRAGGAE